MAHTYNALPMPSPDLCRAVDGPNGPLLPEIRAMFPNTTFIPRPGEINAWDNTDFVNAVKVCLKALLGTGCQQTKQLACGAFTIIRAQACLATPSGLEPLSMTPVTWGSRVADPLLMAAAG